MAGPPSPFSLGSRCLHVRQAAVPVSTSHQRAVPRGFQPRYMLIGHTAFAAALGLTLTSAYTRGSQILCKHRNNRESLYHSNRHSQQSVIHKFFVQSYLGFLQARCAAGDGLNSANVERGLPAHRLWSKNRNFPVVRADRSHRFYQCSGSATLSPFPPDSRTRYPTKSRMRYRIDIRTLLKQSRNSYEG